VTTAWYVFSTSTLWLKAPTANHVATSMLAGAKGASSGNSAAMSAVRRAASAAGTLPPPPAARTYRLFCTAPLGPSTAASIVARVSLSIHKGDRRAPLLCGNGDGT
jgi:hypothetical protein